MPDWKIRNSKPETPYTLVVVDMQYCFEAVFCEKLLNEVVTEIKLAKRWRFPILFLEYDDSKSTLLQLVQLVKGYKKSAFALKHIDDGSNVVHRVIKRKNWPHSLIRLCGVNSDCCVYSTVQGMLKLFPRTKIHLIQNACNTDNPEFEWKQFLKHPRMKRI